MSFPDDPRDLKVSFAFGHSDAEDPTGVTFEQVAPGADEGDPGPVLGGITLTRGRVGDSSLVDPTRIELALRDTDGDFSPRNVTGAHYGQLRNGTPVQVSVDIGAGDVELATAFVPEWNPTWRGPDIDDRVPITALGPLAFLGRDDEAMSAIRRFCDPEISTRVNRLAPRSYWPIDHGEPSATDQAAALAGGVPLRLDYTAGAATASWSAGELASWLGSGLQIDGTVSLTGLAPVDATVTEAVVADVLLRNGLPRGTFGSFGLRLHRAATAGSDTFHYSLIGTLSSFSTGLFVYREDANGGPITPFGAGTDEQADGLWTDRLRHLRVMAVQDGSDVDVSAYLDGELVASGTHSSATLGIPGWQLLMNGTPQAVLGHAVIWAGDAADIPPVADAWAAVQGHVGEAAADRVDRVCAEDGIAVDVAAGDSAAVGPQPIGTILAVLRDAEAADHGVLGERRDGRLYYDPNSSRYNKPVDLVLDYGTEAEPGDISNLRQFDDNRDMRNRVTVTRAGGTSVTVEREDGPVGTDEIGVRPLPVTLNLHEDDQVRHHAGWLLRAGTVNKPRYVILLDLRANPSLRASVIGLDRGSRIQVTGAPSKHVGPDDLDLVVEGERMYLDAVDWLVTLWCEPYEAWRVQQLTDDPPDDDLLDGWLIPDSCALNTGVDTTEDTWLVDIDPLMTTDADDFPCRISINGEEVHVTACSGASSPQTWTVTRSVNGVTKSHEAGDPIELLDALVDSL